MPRLRDAPIYRLVEVLRYSFAGARKGAKLEQKLEQRPRGAVG
jgi:hypothetical protein